jgi:hypothetical protein
MLNADQRLPDRFVLAKGRPKLIVDDSNRGFHWMPHTDDILNAIKRVHARLGQFPILVVIDTVFRSFGGANVNDSAHMNQYVAAATEIATKGADNGDNDGIDKSIALALVHHGTKGTGTPAGSVSLMAGADTLMPVFKHKNKDTGEVSHSWLVDEAKDDADTPARGFVLEVVDDIIDVSNEAVSSCRVVDRGPLPENAKADTGRGKKPKAAETPKAPKEPGPRTPNGEAVFAALVRVFAQDGVPQEREIIPDMPPMPSVTREQLKEQLKAAGRIIGTATGAMTSPERNQLRDVLNALANRKDIVMNAEAIAWPPGIEWWQRAAAKPKPPPKQSEQAPISEAANGGSA